MEKLQLSSIINICGFALQSFAMVLCIYTFNRQRVIFKDYISTSVLVTILSYIVRLLPISMGVQTILNMVFVFLICVILLKMPAYKTIRSTSLSFVLILLCEIMVTAIVVKVMGQEQFEIMVKNPLQSYFIGLLANTMFIISIILIHKVLENKDDSYRDICSQGVDKINLQ